MKISATSALVLNWTDHTLWETPEALSYTNQLDLSEGARLFGLFSEEENFMHLQSVSGRKFFMKKRVLGFLEVQNEIHKKGQVIVLAAGLAPLSVEIGSLFSSCRIFDVDKYLMDDKKILVNSRPPNIEFIDCDILNLNMLKEKLVSHKFDKEIPTIAVLEGIVYYLPVEDLMKIMRFLKQYDIAFVCDICLKPELVNEKTRLFLTEVFRKIKEEINLEFINFYSTEEITGMLKAAGYQKVSITNMQQIQEERTGEAFPFTEENSCWVMNIYAE